MAEAFNASMSFEHDINAVIALRAITDCKKIFLIPMILIDCLCAKIYKIMDCLEPVHKGQFAVVHYCICRQCGLMPAFGATPALVMAVPIVLVATALLANNTRLLTLSLEIRLAGGLVGKTLGKFK